MSKILTEHQAWTVAQAKANLADNGILKETRARELLSIIDSLSTQLAAERGVTPAPKRGRTVTLSDAEREDLFGG